MRLFGGIAFVIAAAFYTVGQAVKDKAEATARAVGGVTDVRNLLQVVKESRQESVKPRTRT